MKREADHIKQCKMSLTSKLGQQWTPTIMVCWTLNRWGGEDSLRRVDSSPHKTDGFVGICHTASTTHSEKDNSLHSSFSFSVVDFVVVVSGLWFD